MPSLAPKNFTNLDMNVADQLFVACLQAEMSPEAAARLRELEPAAWVELFKMAARQRVGPLLFHQLKSQKLDGHMPLPIRDEWQALYRTNAIRNLRLYDELGQILKLLQEAGIPVLVLKGAWLAETVYPQPALRFMFDIDLMVSRGDLARTIEKLSEQGYDSYIRSTLEECFEGSHHWPRLFREGCIAGIEVHWNLTEPGEAWNIDSAPLWERAKPATLAETTVLSLCPEDAVLHLCLHLTHAHLFEKGISPLCDIDRTVRHFENTLDWNALEGRACTWGWERGVHLALYMASVLLKTPVPPQVIQRLEPAGFTEDISQAAFQHLLADNRPKEGISHGFTRFYEESSPLKKIRLFFESLFPSPQVLAPVLGVPSNSPRIYLHYPARLLHLLRHYGTKSLRLSLRLDREERREMAALLHRKEILEDWFQAS